MYIPSLVDIELFVNIAEAKSLTRGAERSFLSLPAASIRIKTLEERLGTKLLSRTSQGITLTPAGQTFWTHGITVLSQMKQLEGELREYANGVKGFIRVFANTTCINEFLPPIITPYLASCSDVTINLEEHTSPEIVHALTDGIADIGIVAGDIPRSGIEVRPFRQYSMVLITSLDHPLVGRESITLEEAFEHDYVGLLQGSKSHYCISQVAYMINKPIKIRIQVCNFEVLATMVAANVGVGILSEPAARRYARTMPISIVPITDRWAVRDSYVCVRSLKELPLFGKELFNLLASPEISVGAA
jgi:DNA-binding transcriptional LysR family regulator